MKKKEKIYIKKIYIHKVILIHLIEDGRVGVHVFLSPVRDSQDINLVSKLQILDHVSQGGFSCSERVEK